MVISAPFILLGLVLCIGLAAAIHDVKTMKIPNYFPLVIIGLFICASPFIFSSIGAFGWQVLAFLTAFGLSLILYILGPMGGGDVKLFAALGLWIPFSGFLQWILYVTLSGVFVSLFFLIVRFFKKRTQTGLPAKDVYKLIRTAKMPYGPAIAAGTLFQFCLSV